MKEFLGKLIRSLPGGGLGRGRDEPDRLGREVVRLYEEGRYRQAEGAARRLVEVQRGRLGERHPDYASALMNLALSLQTQGDLTAAEPLLRQAVEIRREAFGVRDPQYAASLSQLAELLQLRGDLSAAEPLMRQSLEVRKESLGDRHPDYATGLTGLALLLHRRGDVESAEPLLRQALEVRREALGDRHPMVATALGNVGLVLQRRGDVESAEPFLRQALEVRREALGDRHPDYAASLSHLGTLLFERHDHAAAEPLLRQAVTIRKEALGPQHPDVVADLQTLEAILQSRSQPRVVVPPEAGGPAAAVVPIPAAASDSAIEQLGRGPREIAAEVGRLAETFAQVAAALADAARAMQQGHPADMRLLHDAANCAHAHAALHEETLRRAEALDIVPPEGSALGLPDLGALLEHLARVEEELPRLAAVRLRAVTVLDRVLALRHRVAAEAPLLAPCVEAASALHPAVANARLTSGLHPEAVRLVDGTHPLAALLRLVEPDPSMTDDEWSRLHREVASAFGRPLAAAAARSRLEPAPATT